MQAARRPPVYQRSHGTARVVSDAAGLQVSGASGSAKLRFPRAPAGAVEAMVVNTSGGLTAGDTFSVDARADGGRLTLTTPACERVYRCEGGSGEVSNTLYVASGAHAFVLPQPTILFEGSALRRRTEVTLAPGGALTLCEGVVLGRAAMDETLREVDCDDRVEITGADHLLFLDVLRLNAVTLAADGPALLAGHRAIGLVLHVDPSPDAAVVRARAVLDDIPGVLAGASAVNGVAVARLLAPGHTALQDAMARLVYAFSGQRPPRAWSL